MEDVVLSMSLKTPSWVTARSHCPIKQQIWNRKTRSLGLAGSLRICACKSAKASSRLPDRRRSSACISSLRWRSPTSPSDPKEEVRERDHYFAAWFPEMLNL